jgi:hypothetical protein
MTFTIKTLTPLYTYTGHLPGALCVPAHIHAQACLTILQYGVEIPSINRRATFSPRARAPAASRPYATAVSLNQVATGKQAFVRDKLLKMGNKGVKNDTLASLIKCKRTQQ